MKIAVLSDTHANLNALNAVLEHMEKVGYDKSVHLGDLVGYGPKPAEVFHKIINNMNYICMGDTEKAIVEGIDLSGIPPLGKETLYKAVKEFDKEEISLISYFAYFHSIGDMYFSHKSNHTQGITFVGGTHRPSLSRPDGRGAILQAKNDSDGVGYFKTTLEGNWKVDVGSVGMPMDGDNRASYVIYDSETNELEFFRVPYNISKTISELQRSQADFKVVNNFIHAR